MMTEILISLVAIISMLTLISYSASNILAAVPGCVSMPAPTTETFAAVLSTMICLPSSSEIELRSSSTAVSPLAASVVKVMSFVPSRPMDCRITSTLMFFAASTLKILKAMPGVSGTPTIEMRVMLVSLVTPLSSIFSILVTSLTIVPSALFMLESTSSSTLYFFAISTERLLSTWAPSVASSSISS